MRDYRELRQIANRYHDRFSEINYDTSLSLQQKVNLLIEEFKIMAINYKDFIDYLDEFLDKFDDKLYSTLVDILNKWLEDGIIDDVVLSAIKGKQTVIDTTTSLSSYRGEVGETVVTNGFYSLNDRGGGKFILTTKTEDANNVYTFETANGLIAKRFLEDDVELSSFGVKADGVFDNSQILNLAFAFIKSEVENYWSESGQVTHQWATIIRVLFPKGTLFVGQGVNVDVGFNFDFIGRHTMITGNDDATFFTMTGDNCSVGKFDDLYFIGQGQGTGVNYITNNRDQSMVQFNRCKFIKLNEGIIYDNRSSITTFYSCQWYHCETAIRNIRCDEMIFSECWWSDKMHTTHYKASIYLEWGTNIFRDCFFIPHGNYDTNLIAQWESLSDLAWIEMNKDVKTMIDGCRISSEPGFKILINFRGKASLTNPGETLISIKNMPNVSCRNAIVNLTTMPNRLVMDNINNSIAATPYLKLNTSNDLNYKWDDNVFSTLVGSATSRDKEAFKIVIKNCTNQLTTQRILPEILKDYIEADFNIPKKYTNGVGVTSMGHNVRAVDLYSPVTYMIKNVICQRSNVSQKSVIIDLVTLWVDREQNLTLTTKNILKQIVEDDNPLDIQYTLQNDEQSIKLVASSVDPTVYDFQIKNKIVGTVYNESISEFYVTKL